jgi:hypothetical protein
MVIGTEKVDIFSKKKKINMAIDDMLHSHMAIDDLLHSEMVYFTN